MLDFYQNFSFKPKLRHTPDCSVKCKYAAYPLKDIVSRFAYRKGISKVRS